jgi:pimeloyl-ACP methyl ester carboxylesterase
MILVSKTYWAGMPFWFRASPEHATSESLVLRAHDMRQCRALYWTSTKHPAPKVGVVLVHPRIDFGHHYAIPRLLEAGYAVLAGSTRHLNNDTMAEHEEMVLDVGAYVRHLKERRGIEKVVLLGNSGGGSLFAYYQAEARRPPNERTLRSPGGSPTYFEGAPMTPADAMVYVAAHKGQGKMLLDAIDASVVDEADPLSVDRQLDIYDEQNGFREPPAWSEYDPAFLARYRAAQVARVQRIDKTAREMIARHEDAKRIEDGPSFESLPFSERRDVLRKRACEPIMVVYRTMANPTCIDRRIDPSGRDYGSLLSERPDLMNYAALGLARTVTPRAWLSTWSGLSSNADLARNVARIDDPTLIVTPSRDREVFPADTAAVVDAIPSPDKRAVTLDARHYFESETPDARTAEGRPVVPPDVTQLMNVVVLWIAEKVGV